MLIKAIEQDKANILDYLKTEPIYNLFLIADINQFGLENEFMKTFVIKENNKIASVILIYGTTLLFFDPKNLIDNELLNNLIIEHNVKNVNISDKMFAKHQEFFTNQAERFQIHEQFLAKCDKKTMENSPEVKKAEYSDVPGIVESRMQIDEFAQFRSNFDKELVVYQENFKRGISNNFIIVDQEKNIVIAHAMISAKTDQVAMVGGVYCLPNYRNCGYGTKVTTALTNFIIDNNMIAMLFYHNEKAGSIYKKIGYEIFGKVYTVALK
ncbi:GNAT family N-acetyltransferase [Mycoplasmopsis iners]|uniref:GNAT family N-acetyltransferase n=1 Tax=Mycoplasmopsis iners TaxID=76630 RepID=UPI0004979CEC|nr:GNAT family N-acetyltransferase [Mycoplasmopsis iners]